MKKFNVLDVFICLSVVAVVAVAVLYLGGSINNSLMASEEKTLYFTVEITHTRDNFASKINLGDAIEDSSKGNYYGVVSDIKVEPTKIATLNVAEKKIVRSEVSDRETIKLTLKCNGTESDTEIAAEGQVIKVGKRLTLKGKGYAMMGYVVDMWFEGDAR